MSNPQYFCFNFISWQSFCIKLNYLVVKNVLSSVFFSVFVWYPLNSRFLSFLLMAFFCERKFIFIFLGNLWGAFLFGLFEGKVLTFWKVLFEFYAKIQGILMKCEKFEFGVICLIFLL